MSEITKPDAASGKTPPNDVQWMQTNDGSMRIYAPGYERELPCPMAWVDVDSRGLAQLGGGVNGGSVKLEIDRETKPGRFIVKLNLPDESAYQHFDKISAGQFTERLKALRAVNLFEDECRYAIYDPERPRSETMERYIEAHEAMSKSRSEFFMAEGDVKHKREGASPDKVAKLSAVFDTHLEKYLDVLNMIRDGYLRKQGFEPVDPNEAKATYLHAVMPDAPPEGAPAIGGKPGWTGKAPKALEGGKPEGERGGVQDRVIRPPQIRGDRGEG